MNNFNKPTCTLNIFLDCCYHLLTFNQNELLKILTGTLSECERVCIRSVGTELGPNYMQMLSADKERVGNLENNEYQKRLNTNERWKAYYKMT